MANAATKRRPGRPQLVEDENTFTITVRCGEAEAEAWEKLAKGQGLKRSTWMLEVLRLAAAEPDEQRVNMRLVAAARKFLDEVRK
jgi:hypothetical protein